MKKKPPQTAAEKLFRKRIKRRKIRLYAVLFFSFILVLVSSSYIMMKSYANRVRPEIKRAVIQVAKLLPQLEQNEASLRDAYAQMNESWEKIKSSHALTNAGFNPFRETDLDRIVNKTLSWMNRVTKLKVGRDGFMLVVSKETGRILAHPNESYVGRRFSTFTELTEDKVLPIRSIHSWTKPEDLDLLFTTIEPHMYARENTRNAESVAEYFRMSLIGCVLDYDDTYIACGVPMAEMLSYVMESALVFSVAFLILMWLLIKWIILVIESRRETARSMRLKLISYATIVCIVLFGLSWYCQILLDVTNDLKTMDRHAQVAVETLDTYQEQRQNLNDWLNEFYSTQCSIAGQIVTLKGRENLTRQDLQDYAEKLGVKYIYVFNQQGEVVITNSPYDHYRLGDNPDDPTYGFRLLLKGVNSVVADPVFDAEYNEYIQYLGMSLRNEVDLCDGFVMIAVDPALRESLLSPLTVETALSNLIIGLPEYAIAIDKDTLKIVCTTGIGFKDASIESLGLKEENLTDDFSGFLNINGIVYYAGVSETADMYLVPIVCRSSKQASFVTALQLTFFAVITSLCIILLTLFRYQKYFEEGAPLEDEGESPPVEEQTEASIEIEAKAVPRGLFSGFSDLIRLQEKKGLEDRWGANHMPRDQQTPEQRIRRIIYWLLLLFCLFILLPTLYVSLDHSAKGLELNNLAYVISGNWQKGLNIFALTSCIFLLCAMYVAVVLLNRILYQIARISDMRVETVCLLLKNATKYVCVVIFVYYGLSQFGVDTQTLLASAGILSLMISFGAKDLVSDIIAGFFTLFEGSYKVGDYITVGDWKGTVAEIGLRTTKVRLFSETKIFNNSSMRDIINADGAVSRMILQMPISYDADLAEVEAVLAEELPKLSEVIPGLVKPPVYEGVDAFESSSVLLRIAIYVDTDVRYPALRALNREVKLIFDRHNIEIPFNQLVVHEAKE